MMMLGIRKGGQGSDEESEVVSTSPSSSAPPIDEAHVPKKLWRHSSMDLCANLDAKDEAKVLVLYTGINKRQLCSDPLR